MISFVHILYTYEVVKIKHKHITYKIIDKQIRGLDTES